MRNKIQQKLLTVDNNVFYGLINETQYKELRDKNYIVFAKKKARKGGTSGQDLTDYYAVAIIRENFVPDETFIEVIEAMEDLAGVRLSDDEIEYEYTTKGNTNVVIEMVTIYFSKTIKRCIIGSN